MGLCPCDAHAIDRNCLNFLSNCNSQNTTDSFENIKFGKSTLFCNTHVILQLRNENEDEKQLLETYDMLTKIHKTVSLTSIRKYSYGVMCSE